MNNPEFFSWKELFVFESNKIDPQPGYLGNSYGCPMFENHLNALNFALSDNFELKESTPLDIHRMLTKGIPFFEDCNMSGHYRTTSVRIGIDMCPKFLLLPMLMNEWFSNTNKWMDLCQDRKSAHNIAWASHNMFEVIHPFIDGNGRTGRLLFNKVMFELGYDPVIFQFDDRLEYYDCIQQFRNSYWNGMKFDFTSLTL